MLGLLHSMDSTMGGPLIEDKPLFLRTACRTQSTNEFTVAYSIYLLLGRMNSLRTDKQNLDRCARFVHQDETPPGFVDQRLASLLAVTLAAINCG